MNCQTNDGANALLLLCCFYHKTNLIDIIQLLIRIGVDVNCKNKSGRNALYFLLRYYHEGNLLDIMRILIEHGIEVNNDVIEGNL